MKKWLLCGAFCCAFGASVTARELWLIGGGERVCSSVDLRYCQPDKRAEAERYFHEREALFEKSMQFSEDKLSELSRLTNWAGGDEHKQVIMNYLVAKKKAVTENLLTETQWHQALGDFPGSEDELQLIDDVFEVRVKNRFGADKKIEVHFDASYDSTKATLRAYLASAKVFADKKQHAKPVVVIFTASSYNPLEYVDYYLDLFEQVGADARWLPLEPGFIRTQDCQLLNQKRFEMNGAYDRGSRFVKWQSYQEEMCRHPEKLRQLVNEADAFFINGGDQSLTMRSLQNDFGQFTPLAQQFLTQVESGVPLAGTSAGTAVQSGRHSGRIPMISDGTTKQALLTGALAAEINAPLCPMSQACTLNVPSGQLTYRPLGGLQTFTLGVMDTHFFQRGREGRLLRLLSDTQTAFGFGVDEGTTLHAKFISDDEAELDVWGADGVWIADTQHATQTRSPTQWKIEHAYVSRLLAGDKAHFKNGKLTASVCEGKTLAAHDKRIDADAFVNQAGRQWLREKGPAVPSCQREDGRWRYVALPIGLQQDLTGKQ